MEKMLNISYDGGVDPRRKLDVFLPNDAGNGAAVIIIHGGGWSGGKRELYHYVAEHFCKLGFVTATAGYRFAPAHPFPASVYDLQTAFSFFKRFAADQGYSLTKFATFGVSAGGHLSLMLGLNPGEGTKAPDAIVAYCPITDLALLDKSFAHIYMGALPSEQPEAYVRASPIHHIRVGQAPVLLVHGNADQGVPIAQSRAFAEKVRLVGGEVELVELPGIGHDIEREDGDTALKKAERFLLERLLPKE